MARVVVCVVTSMMLVACGDDDELHDEAVDAGPGTPTECVSNPAQIAERRACRADDHCPCGAHCVLGECVATCGQGLPACGPNERCDLFGRCRPASDPSLVGVVAHEPPSEVRIPAGVLLPSATTPTAVHIRPVDRETGLMRLVASEGYEVQCDPAANTWGKECRLEWIVKDEDRMVFVRLAPGADPNAGPGLLKMYWGASMATTTIVPPPAPVDAAALRPGEYGGVAVLERVQMGANPARELTSPLSIDVTAKIFANAGAPGGVLVLTDGAHVLQPSSDWVGSIAAAGSGFDVQLPRVLLASGVAATTGASVEVLLEPEAASVTSDANAGTFVFPLSIRYAGAVEGTAVPIARWMVRLSRTGDLPAGASAPTPPASVNPSLPAARADVPTPIETAVRTALDVWTTGTHPTVDWTELVRTRTETAGDSPRIDACGPPVATLPAAGWQALINEGAAASWSNPGIVRATQMDTAGTTLFAQAYARSNRGPFGEPVGVWEMGFRNIQILGVPPSSPDGIPCAVVLLAPWYCGNSGVAFQSLAGAPVFDRCAEISATYGCVPTSSPGTTGTFSYDAETAQDLSGAGDFSTPCWTGPRQITAFVTRMCKSPARHHCAELMSCYDPWRAPSASAAYAYTPGVMAANVLPTSGDLSCSNPTRTFATAADAARDQASMVAAVPSVLGQCLTELSAARTAPTPSVAQGSGPAGLQQVLKQNPQCLDVARWLASLGYATEPGRERGLRTPALAIDQRSERHAQRLVQQWLAIHAMVAHETAQRTQVPVALRGPAIPEEPGTLPPPHDALDRSLDGWNVLLHPRFATALAATQTDTLRAPDYRAGHVSPLPASVDHLQPQGLPVAMLETLEAQYGLAGVVLDRAARYGDPAQVERAARLLRTTVAMLPLVLELRARAEAASAPTAPAWATKFDRISRSVSSSEARLYDQMRVVARGGNPLGVDDADLPLYFYGTSANAVNRFGAISEYLVGSGVSTTAWAPALVARARTAGDAVTAAYQAHAARRYQAAVDNVATANRLDEIRRDYGTRIVNLCGAPPGTTAANALESWPGTFSPRTCFIAEDVPGCAVDQLLSAGKLSKQDVMYDICVARRLSTLMQSSAGTGDPDLDGLVASLHPSTFAPSGQPPPQCNYPVACPVGGKLECVQCGTRFAPATAALFGRMDLRGYRWPGAREQIDRDCRAHYPEARTEVPEVDDFVPARESPSYRGACYRGAIGELALTVRAASKDVEVARAEFDEHREAYDIAMTTCHAMQQVEDDIRKSQERAARARSSFAFMRTVFSGITSAISALNACGTPKPNATKGDNVNPVSCATAPFRIAADVGMSEVNRRADEAQREHNAAIEAIRSRAAMAKCMNEASQHLVGSRTATLRIERAVGDAISAIVRFNEAQADAQRARDEGLAALEVAQGRTLRQPALDDWLDPRVATFAADMRQARRATYLAVRAVEYEYQASMSLRQAVLTAETPAELENVIAGLRATAGTLSIAGNRPSNLKVVLSLRQHLLQLHDKHDSSVVVPLSEADRFALLLHDPRFRVSDAGGNYLGQRIPFNLAPVGTLGSDNAMGIPVLAGSDCAERVWSVNASILGNGKSPIFIGDATTFARVDLLKSNAFYSQWCQSVPGRPLFQQASVRPTRNLFRDPEFGVSMLGGSTVGGSTGLTGSASGIDDVTRARIQAYFDVPRAMFELDDYANGETSELAARGLYGEYALFIPAAVISNEVTEGATIRKTPGLDLEAVSDILLRIDYVSVAR